MDNKKDMKFIQEILTPVSGAIQQFANRNAFYIQGEAYTYRQFGERVSAIRAEIRRSVYSVECKGEQIWGLAIQDNLDTYASIFALWMEGKCYVPLHPSWPSDRIASIIDQIGCSNVIVSENNALLTEIGGSLTIIDVSKIKHTNDHQSFTNGTSIRNDFVETSEDDLAYILFTSGSTGVPKGVQLTRGNIAAFMDSFWKTGITIDETDRCMQVFDLTFDVSVQSYLVALTRGACVYTVPYGQVKYLYAASLIQEQHITFGAMAPSMLTYLRPYFDEFDASSMKACILTAEACPVDLMEEWYKCAKNTEIYDFYGPTEATIYCTYYKLTRGGNNLSLNGIISIGKPMANVQAIILDEEGNIIPRPDGVKCSAYSVKAGDIRKGELCVAGPQVTPGYWNNPEKNAEAFFELELPADTLHTTQTLRTTHYTLHNQKLRFYHTGDLCYWDESGNIMYSGRIDQQAKIQGFRVELGEIEFHAREYYNKEKRVMAIAFQNEKNLTEIAMFIESAEMDTKALEAYMRTKMPHYMIPTRFIFLPEFPLNKSEKVDRNALKAMLLNV